MKYYLTTPLYYVNAAPHIGHTYTTLAADTIKRMKRMQGFNAVLTTGTDEHGQKVERSAESCGRTAKEFVDMVSAEFRRQWDSLHVSYDHFIRTTDSKHEQTVQWLFQRCEANGYIYKGSYTGQYCVSDELYVNEAKPGDACPFCGRPTETVTEENYFFKLSAFGDRLLELYSSQADFVRPESRKNEVISFVKQGLQDLSISRTTLKWGIPLPVEGQHVFYVWFDALIGYLSAVRESGEWPADLHLVGKEIVRFHAVFWPAFLMAADLPLPGGVFAHGWLLFENDKMSKSRGNIVRTDPIREVMGIEALRYFLLREIVFGQDGAFSYDALIARYNSDLANGLGNLVNRTLTMVKQYRSGVVPQAFDVAIGDGATQAIEAATAAFDRLEFSRGLETIWQLLGSVDKFIVEEAPWKLARSTEDESQKRLDRALGTAAETLRVAAVLLAPVMPESCAKIWEQLGFEDKLDGYLWRDLRWGSYPAGQTIGTIAAVYPRIEAAVAIEQMRVLEKQVGLQQAALLGKTPEPQPPSGITPISETISIEDFAKVDLRVGQVKSADAVKGADKLLHLKVDIGEPELRTIVAGIAMVYKPEDLIGRKVVIVANLEPRKLRGIVSQGMIVAASLDGGETGTDQLSGRCADRCAPEVTLADSHCHLDSPRFQEDVAAVIARAREAGVTRFVAIGTGEGPPDLEAGIRIAEQHEGFLATVGVHPHDAAKADDQTFQHLDALCGHPKVVALGEIGLDYHYDFSPRAVQVSVFERQLEIARGRLPIVIHTRDAWADTLDILRTQWKTAPGVMHCFTGGPDEAKEALDLGFYVSFGGVLTFPNAEKVRDAARMVPEDLLLVETDAPYLAPVPNRGKRNEPAFLVDTVRKLAEIRGTDAEHIAAITNQNFDRLCRARESRGSAPHLATLERSNEHQ